MMKQWNKNKQHGVVLLTCLIFLLVLLAMLRFVLGSAKLEEEKAGIDLEIFTAREAAQSAISYAEYFILKQGQLYCGDPATCNEAGSANAVFNEKEADLAKRSKSAAQSGDKMAVPAIKDALGKGLYTGEYIQAQAQNCKPLWICVNWGNSAESVTRSAKKRGGDQKLLSMECPNCSVSGAVKPRFIIERYTDKELKARNLGELEKRAPGSVVFRITAVGFGKGSNTSENLTNVMLESTYVIPR